MRTVQWLGLVIVCLCRTALTPVAAEKTGNNAPVPVIAADIKPTALWDGRKEVDFHALNFPTMVRARDAGFLIDDEYVLGITEHGESRAYPTRFVSWHHIINDKIGAGSKGGPAFVTITYCIVCNSGIRFETPQVHNKAVLFDFYGLYNGVMTMYDKSTESVWLQVEGRAVKGPLLGTTLKQGPLLDTTWGQWRKLHPDTLVMAPDPHFNDCYEPKGSVMVRGYTAFPAAYFRPTLTHRDARLGMFESVLAVSVPRTETVAPSGDDVPVVTPSGSLFRAYPMKAFKAKTGAINDMMGATPVGVFFLADSETMSAVSRTVDGQTLTLEVRKDRRGKLAFYDQETGTRWNVEGHAEAGPLAGKEMRRIDSHMSQWYGWVSYFPRTTIYEPATQGRKTALPATRNGEGRLIASYADSTKPAR